MYVQFVGSAPPSDCKAVHPIWKKARGKCSERVPRGIHHVAQLTCDNRKDTLRLAADHFGLSLMAPSADGCHDLLFCEPYRNKLKSPRKC